MSVEVQQIRRFNSMERRPRMLKDFLSENPNSCNSSGFKSLPRKPPNGVVTELNNSSKSTFQTLLNTITSFSFFAAARNSSPSVLSLPRSLSRKLIRRRNRRQARTVKIKDIIRWKSFRDVAEEEGEGENLHHRSSLPPPPKLDFHRCTTESTTTVTTTCSSSSCGSSWSDGDFFTSLWEVQNDDVEGGKNSWFSPEVVGKGLVPPYAAAVGAREVLTCQEDEQHSPVSVLQVGEDDFSIFDQSLANIKRRKQKFIQTVERFENLAKFDQCLSLDENSGYGEELEDDDTDDYEDQNVEEQDWVEERAQQLLLCVRATGSPVQSCKDYLDHRVLLDFFREELTGRRNDEEFEWEMLRIAEDWMNGSFDEDIGHVNKDAYIKDMDRRCRWSGFEDEKDELAMQIEKAILHSLIADLLDLDC